MIRTMMYLLAIGLFCVALVLAAAFMLQERLLFFPEKLDRAYRFSFGYPVEEVFLQASDGAEIHALYFQAEKPQGAVLYFHGNAGSARSWGFVAEPFVQRGYSVLMPDYRSYGKSTGRLSEKALHLDAALCWQYLRRHYPENRIVVYGRSLGTGIAVQLAAEQNPAALVLETPYSNLADVAGTHFPFLPARLLLRYTFPSDKLIARVHCPIYMLHGTHDQVIPYELGTRLASMAPGPVTFVTVHGGGHNNLADFPEYEQLLDTVLTGRK